MPEYLTLLHGVIDSPDIPLNVSRSYLQSDANVKKISNHITKKVADKLFEIYRDQKDEFAQKWENIKLFVQYGMLTDEKFYERATKFALYKSISGDFYTQEDYVAKVKDAQTDKDGNLVILYTQDREADYAAIEHAKAKGYDVLEMTGELDVHIISQAEQKNEKTRFVRIDSDLVENLIRKEEKAAETLSSEQQDGMRHAFESILPETDKLKYYVTFENASEDALPVFLTQNEFMRRMREMSAHQQGMSFYGEMPEQYNLVLNTAHPLIKELVGKMTSEQKEEKVEPKEGEEAKNETVLKTVYTLSGEEERIHQLMDIALLAAGKLKGEALSKFVNRSLTLLK